MSLYQSLLKILLSGMRYCNYTPVSRQESSPIMCTTAADSIYDPQHFMNRVSIGWIDNIFPCGAHKFKGESSSMCCSKQQVSSFISSSSRLPNT